MQASPILNKQMHMQVLLCGANLQFHIYIYQADTYRRMRKLLRGSWEAHAPSSNALWLHYLADVLLQYKTATASPAEKRELRSFRFAYT